MSKNLDPQEIEKFNQMAADWWDEQGPMKPLHQINPLRMEFIETHIGSLSQKKVLDIGTGGGILAEALCKKGAAVTGIDLCNQALLVAREHAKDQGLDIDYQLVSAEQLASEQAGAFDCVTCLEMLEHVPDPAAVVKAAAMCVKPGGTLFFSTISRNPKSFLFAIIGAEYILRLLPRGTHRYEKFIKPSELDRFADQAHCQLQAITGLSYAPLTRHFSLSNDVSVNYMACYRKD